MKVKTKKATYTATTVSAVMINYAIGTGMLNLPHTLARASVVTSAIFVCVISLVSYCLARYTLAVLRNSFALGYHLPSEYGGAENGYRAENDEEAVNYVGEPQNAESGSSEAGSAERKPLLRKTGDSGELEDGAPNFSIPNDVTIQVSRMCYIYYGKAGFYVYQIALMLNLFGSIWGYSQVVASSLTSVIPFTSSWLCEDPCGAGGYAKNCETAYIVYIVLALAFGCSMVFVDMSRQKILQTFFSSCRLVCIASMAILVFVSIFAMPYTAGQAGPPYVQKLPVAEFDFKHVGTLFSSATFSLIMHHSIPGIVYPIIYSEVQKLSKTIILTFLALFSFTTFLGFSAAFFFGENGANLITLNLTRWDGHTWTSDSQPVWAAIISYFVRLLPPIWVLSCLPINGITLSNNILEIVPQAYRTRKSVIAAMRLLAVAPPVILAGFARCLGDIIEFTGLCAYVLLIMPAFLMLRSKRRIAQRYPQHQTQGSWIDSDAMIWFTIVFNCVGVVNTTYSIIAGLAEE